MPEMVTITVDDETIQKYIQDLGISQYIIKPSNLSSIKDAMDKTMHSLQ